MRHHRAAGAGYAQGYDGQLTRPDYSDAAALAAGRSVRRNGMEPTMPNTLYVALEQDKARALKHARKTGLPHTMANAVYAIPMEGAAGGGHVQADGDLYAVAAGQGHEIPEYGAVHGFGGAARGAAQRPTTTHVVDDVAYVAAELARPASTPALASAASPGSTYADLYAQEAVNPAAAAAASNYAVVSSQADEDSLYEEAVRAEHRGGGGGGYSMLSKAVGGWAAPAPVSAQPSVDVGGYQIPLDTAGGYDSQLTCADPTSTGVGSSLRAAAGGKRKTKRGKPSGGPACTQLSMMDAPPGGHAGSMSEA